jgi:three-Cys-motif partner protein
VEPSFREYHLIDLDQDKVEYLSRTIGDQDNVYVYEGDCNPILLGQIFPKVQFVDFCRGLCLLDPYGLHLDWKVTETAGQMKTIDLFLNFPVMDMNRNVLWRHPEKIARADIERMNRFWGDSSWRNIAYTTQRDLFGYEEKVENEAVAEGFRDRLRQVAGFEHVPQPLPMRNSTGATVYYLFFASQKPVAANIVGDIFRKYQRRRD